MALRCGESERNAIPAEEKADAFEAGRVHKDPFAIGFVNGKGEFGIAFAINQAAWIIQRDVKLVASEQSHRARTVCILDAKKERAFKRETPELVPCLAGNAALP